MNKQVITLSERAANRVKEIIAKAKEPIVGVRVGVASGGCAGMSYVMEYAKENKPNDEVMRILILFKPKRTGTDKSKAPTIKGNTLLDGAKPFPEVPLEKAPLD